jgi:hypothetical protein
MLTLPCLGAPSAGALAMWDCGVFLPLSAVGFWHLSPDWGGGGYKWQPPPLDSFGLGGYKITGSFFVDHSLTVSTSTGTYGRKAQGLARSRLRRSFGWRERPLWFSRYGRSKLVLISLTRLACALPGSPLGFD